MKEVTPNSGQGLAKKVLFQEQKGGGEKGALVAADTEKKGRT